MLITSIKSKQTYSPLLLDPKGRRHLLVAQGSGGEAILRILHSRPHSVLQTEILYACESASNKNLADRLDVSGIAKISIYQTISELIGDLPTWLSSYTMGLRLYIAGSESFIWSVSAVAGEFGMSSDEIQREHCGTLSRRVYCVHCKTINETVKTNIAACRGCGCTLLVRDHFSRRLGAYMGVKVDAEAPGEVPKVEEEMHP